MSAEAELSGAVSFSGRAPPSFEDRRSTLQTYLDHAPRLVRDDRAGFSADAHRVALAAFEASTTQSERSQALKLWAELCIWESDGLAEPERSQQLQQAVAKLEQATLADPSHVGARKALARALSKLAERDDHYTALYSDFERASVSAPHDWRVWHDWAQTLSEHAGHVDSSRARELLSEAAELLQRGSDTVEEPAARARLIDDRGATLRALAQRSSVPDGLAHLERSQLEFQHATEREPELEAAWKHWAESLLEQARLADVATRRAELEASALEVLWRGIQAMTDPHAGCRLALQRGQALFAIARLSQTAAESDAKLTLAIHEFERAAGHDPNEARAFCDGASALRARAELARPEWARARLREALELIQRGLRHAPDAAARAHLHREAAETFIALGHASRARERRRAFERATDAFEQAVDCCRDDIATLRAQAHWACERARHAEPERARELVMQAFDRLSNALLAVSGEAAAAELLHARGLVSLTAADLRTDAQRARQLDRATADFEHACGRDRTWAPAWCSWSRVFGDRARRASDDEAARELFARADEILDAAVQNVPLGEGTAELLRERADLFLAQAKLVLGDERSLCYERALACLEEATQLAADSGSAWQSWGRALAERARFDESVYAVDCFAKAAERYAHAAKVRPIAERGGLWIEYGRQLGAFARRVPEVADRLVNALAARFERLIGELPSRRAEFCLARGNLWAAAGHYAAAEADYTHGRDSEAPLREALYCQHQLSSLLEERGCARREWRRTRRAYTQYVRDHEPYLASEVFGYWGSLSYEQFGPNEQAEAQLVAAIDRGPQTASRFQMVRVELARERAESDPRALPAFEDGVRAAQREIETADLDPAERALELGKLALYAGDHAHALEQLDWAFTLDPWSAAATEMLGLALLDQGQFRPACDQLSIAYQLAPRDHAILPLWAAALARAGDVGRAEQQFQAALAAVPHDARVLLGWAEACVARASARDPEHLARAFDYAGAALAAAHAEKCRRLRAKQRARAHYLRGYARIKLAEREDRGLDSDAVRRAIGDFRAALRIDSRHYDARRALARLTAAGLARRTGLQSLQRAASGLIAVLALGVFAIAQLGYWPQAEPVLQFCAGTECSPPLLLRELNLASYSSITFGAFICIALAVVLPRWLRPKTAHIALEQKPIGPDGTRAVTPR
jgi:Flp pilus assembly protein TadD